MLLDRLPWPIIDGDALVGEMIKVLARDWWSRDPSSLVKIDHSAHMDMLAQLTQGLNPATAAMVYDLEDQIPWLDLAETRTHGNPTFTNTYKNAGGYRIVIIDDWPAEPAVPDVVSVDYGTILMSALGYDQLRFSDYRYPILGAAKLQQLIDQRHGADAGREKLAAKYWCVVNLLRNVKLLHAPGDEALVYLLGKALSL